MVGGLVIFNAFGDKGHYKKEKLEMEIIKSDGYYFLISTCDICEGDGVLEVCINNGWYQGSEATPSYAEQPCDVCEGEGKIEEILTEDEWEEQNG